MGLKTPLNWTYDASKGLIIDLRGNLNMKLSKDGQLAYGLKIEV